MYMDFLPVPNELHQNREIHEESKGLIIDKHYKFDM